MKTTILSLFLMVLFSKVLLGQDNIINYCFVGLHGNDKYEIYYKDSLINTVSLNDYKGNLSLIVPRKYRNVCFELKVDEYKNDDQIEIVIYRKRNMFSSFKDTKLNINFVENKSYLVFKINKKSKPKNKLDYIWLEERPSFQ